MQARLPIHEPFWILLRSIKKQNLSQVDSPFFLFWGPQVFAISYSALDLSVLQARSDGMRVFQALGITIL